MTLSPTRVASESMRRTAPSPYESRQIAMARREVGRYHRAMGKAGSNQSSPCETIGGKDGHCQRSARLGIWPGVGIEIYAAHRQSEAERILRMRTKGRVRGPIHHPSGIPRRSHRQVGVLRRALVTRRCDARPPFVTESLRSEAANPVSPRPEKPGHLLRVTSVWSDTAGEGL